MTLKIGVMYQSEFGGTNVLLEKFSHWLSHNKFIVFDIEDAKRNQVTLDYIILPTSEISVVFPQMLKGLMFKHYIIWSMGHGAFRAAFINERAINKKRVLGTVSRIITPLIDFFIQSLLENKRIIFTDCVGLSHDAGKINNHEAYQHLVFPIVVDKSNLCHHQLDRELRFGWVGRVDNDFKVGPLISLLHDLDLHHRDGLVNINKFVVIGDGNAMDLLREEIKRLSFNVTILGMVPNTVLSKTINDNMDVLCAMGTSILEGAKIMLPSIIVNPFSLGSSEQSGYRWIYDSIGYSLGEFSLGKVSPIQRKVDLKVILSELELIGYDYHSVRSYEYVDSFYPDSVFGALSEFINEGGNNTGLIDKLFFFVSFNFRVMKKLIKRFKKKEK